MHEADAVKGPQARVALVVIARDEAPRIQRLLQSVAPWVDEMLVLDTGSSDATPALAAACGARVEHFNWCDDFAAARNAALELTGADWHLVLDADEWIVDGGPALRALRHTRPDFVGSIELVDRFVDGHDGQTRQVQVRLSRVLPGALRYSGRIHEQPQHGLRLRPLPLRVGHDGYLPERLQAKQGRNRRLLEQALASAPDDAYLWYQLGKDAGVYDDHARAESAFARVIALAPARPPWWPDLVARRLHGLKRLALHAQGLDFASSQMEVCAESPDFFFALGDLLLDWGAEQPDLGDQLLPMIEQAWRSCLELGERPDQQGAVTGRGSFLAAKNLALVFDATGRGAQAQALRQAWPLPTASARAD